MSTNIRSKNNAAWSTLLEPACQAYGSYSVYSAMRAKLTLSGFDILGTTGVILYYITTIVNDVLKYATIARPLVYATLPGYRNLRAIRMICDCSQTCT